MSIDLCKQPGIRIEAEFVVTDIHAATRFGYLP